MGGKRTLKKPFWIEPTHNRKLVNAQINISLIDIEIHKNQDAGEFNSFKYLLKLKGLLNAHWQIVSVIG